MAEHEQGAERFQYTEYGYDIVDTKTDMQWSVTKDAAHPQKLLDLLNALEADNAALRTQLAAAVCGERLEMPDNGAALARTLTCTRQPGHHGHHGSYSRDWHQWDALASPSRDTGSRCTTLKGVGSTSVRCELVLGHTGDHKGGGRVWGHDTGSEEGKG